jgi:hypothetical protein
MRICGRCGVGQPEEAFPFADKARGSRRGECRPCYRKTRIEQRMEGWVPTCYRCKGPLGDLARRMGRRLCKACDVTYDSTAVIARNSRRKTLAPCSLCGGPKERGVARTKLCAACKPWEGYAKSLRLYGLTPADYVAMLDGQGGVCAICGEPPNGQRLHIDHDHAHPDGGKASVRGLLCRTCNYVRLAVFQDDANLLRKAAAYLEAR